MPGDFRSPWIRASVAPLSVLLALTARLLLLPLIGRQSPYMLFFAAVLISAWLAGSRAGLLAVLLGALAAYLFLLDPPAASGNPLSRALSLALFILEGSLVSTFIGALRGRIERALHSVAQINQQLQHELAERTQAEAALRLSEQRLRGVITRLPLILWATDVTGVITMVEGHGLDPLGYSPGALVGTPLSERLSSWPEVSDYVARALAGEDVSAVVTARGRSFDARYIPLRDQDGAVIGMIAIAIDISEHIRIEAALRESEQRFRNAFDYAAIGMALIGLDGRWLRVNPAVPAIVGYSAEELSALTFQDITHPDDIAADLAYARQLLEGRIPYYHMEKRYIQRDGRVVWILLSGSLVRDGDGQPRYFIAQIQDITERKAAEAHVYASLREKEVLLKEIHHRVKNNLQVIISLLRLQSNTIADAAARELFRDSQSRVQSMALVHEQLYRSADLSHINVADYIHSLATSTLHLYAVRPDQVTLVCQIDGAIKIEIDTAIPIGLILTELLSNSMKHAFRDGRRGTVTISLRASDGQFVLTVRDDGVGLPADFAIARSESLGLQLVANLVEQLRGSLALDRRDGTAFEMVFPGAAQEGGHEG